MALFDWLFGKSKARKDKALTARAGWAVSENGNPMLIEGSTRITVFQQDRGWKYCISDIEDREEPYFSEAYSDKREAQEEALARLRGEPARHPPHSASYVENRRERWEAQIRDRAQLIEEIQRYLSENSDLSITALRKPEAKVTSHLNQLEWQIAEYRRAGVSVDLITIAEKQKPALTRLAKEISSRIDAKLAQRPPRKALVSDSQLSSDLARKVDELIRLFADKPVMDENERELLYRQTTRATTAKMLDEGITYGQASGAPEFLNQDEESFRIFMKQADQDLGWQCDTVTDSFNRYLETGEIPAPHYPMRIAILLRKAKDFDREKRFLEVWCKHFPSGNGATYTRLVERAKKSGAIPLKTHV
ncbi:hypothetical protein [Aquibaculum arenosum]|uniref:Uncharacterized protein n=1 Tax=Aquibaculum arenosum TaxID=3032591 RepID=A0ABT5YN50_9PROT|nr:hypothetical protein [Fodinicurvata sp. CAU 1616]MDF2096396.1 hypothetical protein [Fodinicurvata sp. CAU 1616]